MSFAMAFIERFSRFARSPQGRRVMSEAKKLASDPARRRQIDDLRRRLASRRSGKPH